jgi:hypothetical protein
VEKVRMRVNLPEPKVTVTIIDDTSVHACEGDCAVDWAKPKSLAQARQKIADRFGDDVGLEYVDLPKAAETDFLREVKARTTGMPFPILLANRDPRIAGEFDLRQLIDVIEAELEKTEI